MSYITWRIDCFAGEMFLADRRKSMMANTSFMLKLSTGYCPLATGHWQNTAG